MTLRDWIKRTPPAERARICSKIGTTMDYLWQIAGGHSRPGVRLSLLLEAETGVTRYQLRPDVFGNAPDSPRHSSPHANDAAA